MFVGVLAFDELQAGIFPFDEMLLFLLQGFEFVYAVLFELFFFESSFQEVGTGVPLDERLGTGLIEHERFDKFGTAVVAVFEAHVFGFVRLEKMFLVLKVVKTALLQVAHL